MRKFAIAGLLSASVLATTASANKGVYSDMPANHWAYAQIKALTDAGIIRGTGSGKFNGDEKISRYEAAVMVHNGVQHVMKVKGMGGSIDPEIMDTLNSLITELTDELQVSEVRIEENSDAIAQLRQHVHNMNRGFDMPVGAGRIKFMGQSMFSVVAGGDNSSYSTPWANNNTGVLGTANPREGATEFLVDYFDLGIAADIDSKTSFHTRASVYTGGNAGGAAGGMTFDDYMYFHVKNLWDKWDMTMGRMYLPTGHEVGGAFRTNPYFITNSLVEQMYGNMVTGAHFSYQTDSKWNWGFAIHNGDVETPGNKVRNHANHANAFANTGVLGAFVVPGVPGLGNPGAGNVGTLAVGGLNSTNTGGIPAVAAIRNSNGDDDFGYLIQVGRDHKDGDFKWDVTYFTNGAGYSAGAAGTALAPANAVAGQAEMDYFNVGATYRANSDWQFSAEYTDGTVENYVGTAALGGPAADLAGRTSMVGGVGSAGIFSTVAAIAASANGVIVEDDFTTWYLQAVYNLNSKSTLAVRYGVHEVDRVGLNTGGVNNNGTFNDEIDELAFAWTRKVSDNGTIIVEYSQVDYDLIRGMSKSQFRGAGANLQDDYDVIRASYRIDF